MSSPLRQKSIVALLTAEVISAFGSTMTFLALPWFVLSTTGSPAKMSAVLAVELLPLAILGIPSGTVVSRLGARRTMLYSDLARVPLMVSIPLLHELGVLSFPLLLVLVSLIGVFLAPYFAAQILVLPELVGEDETTVAQATAIVEGARRATGLVGPLAAGLLIAVLGAAPVLYIDAATFLVSFALLALFVPQRPPVAQTDESKGVGAGIRFVLNDRMLRILAGNRADHERTGSDAGSWAPGSRLRGLRRELEDRRALLRRVRGGCGDRRAARGPAWSSASSRSVSVPRRSSC